MADVRKELNFCKKTGVRILGVVGNMCGLQLPVSLLRFMDPSGKDRTNEVQRILSERVPELASTLAGVDVFDASAQGAQKMAARFGVPYLGSIPMDLNLTRSCEEGRSFLEAYAGSAAASQFRLVVETIERAVVNK